MLSLTVKLSIHPDKIELAREPLLNLVTSARKMDGVHTFDLGADIQEPNIIYISEVYENNDVKNNVESSGAFHNVIKSIGAFFLNPPEVAVYEVNKTS
jgi:quinol monooxygenase YgiN